MLNRLLFLVTVAIAVGLIGLVVFAPVMIPVNKQEQPRWLLLFALDATIRRAAIACAVGLIVTAAMFFRPAARSANSPERPKRPRSGNTIGA